MIKLVCVKYLLADRTGWFVRTTVFISQNDIMSFAALALQKKENEQLELEEDETKKRRQLINLISSGKTDLAKAYARRWGIDFDSLENKPENGPDTERQKDVAKITAVLRREFDPAFPESYAIHILNKVGPENLPNLLGNAGVVVEEINNNSGGEPVPRTLNAIELHDVVDMLLQRAHEHYVTIKGQSVPVGVSFTPAPSRTPAPLPVSFTHATTTVPGTVRRLTPYFTGTVPATPVRAPGGATPAPRRRGSATPAPRRRGSAGTVPAAPVGTPGSATPAPRRGAAAPTSYLTAFPPASRGNPGAPPTPTAINPANIILPGSPSATRSRNPPVRFGSTPSPRSSTPPTRSSTPPPSFGNGVQLVPYSMLSSGARRKKVRTHGFA